MTITAYTNRADTNYADKSGKITLIGSYTVDPYNVVDIERPVFIIDYSPALVGCNYLYVDDFSRFYFVTNAVNKGGQIVLECLSDPLTSFLSYINGCDITVLRSESAGAPTMYEDTKLPVYPNKNNVTSIEMQSDNEWLNGNILPPPNNSFLLTVIGGSPSI